MKLLQLLTDWDIQIKTIEDISEKLRKEYKHLSRIEAEIRITAQKEGMDTVKAYQFINHNPTDREELHP